jgi:hypothetical protein
LAADAGGFTDDVCRPDEPFSGSTCSVQTIWYLSDRPYGAVQVFVDGQPSPGTDWTFDASLNAVTFRPEAAPRNGATLEVRYGRSCLP